MLSFPPPRWLRERNERIPESVADGIVGNARYSVDPVPPPNGLPSGDCSEGPFFGRDFLKKFGVGTSFWLLVPCLETIRVRNTVTDAIMTAIHASISCQKYLHVVSQRRVLPAVKPAARQRLQIIMNIERQRNDAMPYFVERFNWVLRTKSKGMLITEEEKVSASSTNPNLLDLLDHLLIRSVIMSNAHITIVNAINGTEKSGIVAFPSTILAPLLNLRK